MINVFTEKSELSQQLNQGNEVGHYLAQVVFYQPSISVRMLPLRNREEGGKQAAAS